MATQEERDDYEEGFEAGKEAAEKEREASFGEHAEEMLRELLIQHPLEGKSEMWVRGFKNGKEGDWDPPEVHEEDDDSEDSEE